MAKRAVVAMSGGIDSTMTAYLLKNQGYEVIGVTFKFFEGSDHILEDAEKSAALLGIKWFFEDYVKYFEKDVVSYFISSYRKGETPNPCSFCNKHAKFTYLFEKFLQYDADFAATGHYCREAVFDGHKHISKGVDLSKDQSYYLALLDEKQVNMIRFPLGGYTKTQIKEMAEDAGFFYSEKKESQEICFLQGEEYGEFLKRKISYDKFKSGEFVLYEDQSKVIGGHPGIELFTVGQRRGLGIGHHEPLYVKSIDSKSRQISLTLDSSYGEKGVRLRDCQFNYNNNKITKASAKLRYRSSEAECIVEMLPENKANILFSKNQRFPAIGQVAAVYIGDVVLGGGYIEGFF